MADMVVLAAITLLSGAFLTYLQCCECIPVDSKEESAPPKPPTTLHFVDAMVLEEQTRLGRIK